MRVLALILGMLLLLVGTLFLVQDFNILPGDFFLREIPWKQRGFVAVLAGLIVIFLSNESKRP